MFTVQLFIRAEGEEEKDNISTVAEYDFDTREEAEDFQREALAGINPEYRDDVRIVRIVER